jgi:hypothetical protein
MRQESDSFQRFMVNVTTYEHLKGLVPPEGMAQQQKRWHDALAKLATGSGGEYRNVNMAARIIDDLVRSGDFNMTEHEGALGSRWSGLSMCRAGRHTRTAGYHWWIRRRYPVIWFWIVVFVRACR